jgi:hypothetical protein
MSDSLLSSEGEETPSPPDPLAFDPIHQLIAGAVDYQNLAPSAIEGLRLLAVSDNNLETRLQAIGLLGRAARPSQYRILETLLELVKEPEPPAIQIAAARCLRAFGSRAVPAMLRAIRESEETPYRAALIVLLGQIGLEAGAARPVLEHLRSHPELGPLCRQTLTRLAPGLDQFLIWLAGMIQSWCIVGIGVCLALLVVALIAARFGGFAHQFKLPDAARPGRPFGAVLVVLGVFIIVAIIQFVRAMLRYSRPDKAKFWDSTYSPLKLSLALALFGGLFMITLNRLGALP